MRGACGWLSGLVLPLQLSRFSFANTLVFPAPEGSTCRDVSVVNFPHARADSPYRAPLSSVIEFVKSVRIWLHALARRKGLACLFVALLCPALRLALLPVLPIPIPAIQDEFSYILAGDTFAHGRLANPTHPFWQHFETFHTLQLPTYASKYPPLQGMALAVGEWLGNPWFGVCISMGLMCGALCWMMQAWLTPTTALVGSLIVVIQIGVTSYWMNSYWGGAVAALGGALVIGALGHLRKRIQIIHSALFFVGVALLINTRPFEGAVLSLIAGGTLACEVYRRHAWRPLIARFVPVGMVMLSSTCAGMLYYNFRVTGNAFQLPYVEYERQYAISPPLLAGGLRPVPQYRHVEMRRFATEYEAQVYETSISRPLAMTGLKLLVVSSFFVGNALLLVPLGQPGLWKSRKTRLWLILFGVFAAALSLERFVLPHYAAPATGLFFLIYVAGWRRMRYWYRNGKPIGCINAYALVGLMLLNAASPPNVLTAQPEFAKERREVLARLNGAPGKHLVFVRYTPQHNVHDEWVFNAAEIDNSRIVWSREMGPELDRPLARYYRDRDVWLLKPDCKVPELRLYSELTRR